MAYNRVVPRDLFNEAGLLKCLGRVWILLDEMRGHSAALSEGDGAAFDIVQNEGSGAISVANLDFTVAGELYYLERPLNSRKSWELWVEAGDDGDFESVEVFDDDGNFTADMLALIRT